MHPHNLQHILKLMGLGRTLPKENPMQFALKVCYCNISCMQDADYILWWSYCDSGENILRVKALEAFTNTTTCSGEAATHDNNPMFGENPVASMWLPIGTCLIVLQDFLEVATEQSLTRFTKHAKVVFPTASDRKDLQPAKKNSEQLRKKAGFLGSLGRFGVSKHRACGFDMPTCTEWCLRGLQRRTLEARSCNYKPCWFIYLRVHYLRLLVTDM